MTILLFVITNTWISLSLPSKTDDWIVQYRNFSCHKTIEI